MKCSKKISDNKIKVEDSFRVLVLVEVEVRYKVMISNNNSKKGEDKKEFKENSNKLFKLRIIQCVQKKSNTPFKIDNYFWL